MFCIQCGTENSAHANFCIRCGSAMEKPAPATSLPKDESTLPMELESSPVLRRAKDADVNFIVKHWRGDFSLAFSYWIIGSLLTLVMLGIMTAVGASALTSNFGAVGQGASILAFFGVVMAVTLWQLVGIWRSADKHPRQGGSPVWAGLAKVMVVLGLLRGAGEFATQGYPIMAEGARLIAGIDNVPTHQIRLLREGTELELAGGMPFGTTDAVKKFLDSTAGIKVIHLNSQGGRMNEAYKLYQVIKQQGLTTYTSAECVSACAVAFLAGKERYLGEKGRLGFHSVSVGDLSGEVATELNAEVRRMLKVHGAPESFINRALSTSPKDMWYPGTDELLEARVIDSVVDSRYFGLSGVAQWRDAHKFEEGLLQVPFYSALAQYDPQNYAKLRDVLVAGIQTGRAQIEISQEIRAIFMGQLIPRYLKESPDEALVRYWSSQIAEMRYLAKLNPQHCADFAFPQFAKSVPDLQRLIPKEMIKEDLNSLAEVVKGVATNPQASGANRGAQSDLELIFARLADKYPWAPAVIQSPAAYKHDPGALCGAVTALYSEVLAMPSISRSGAVLRYMMSQ